MNIQQALEQPTVTTTSFRPTMFPHQPGDKLVIPKSLADRVGAALAAKGHKVQISLLQQPYFQQTAAAGAVKMIVIDPRTGIIHGGARAQRKTITFSVGKLRASASQNGAG